MMDDVESGKIGIVVMKDMTRWGRDYLQVGNAMEIFRRNRVRFIAVNNGIDSEKPDTLEFAPFINSTAGSRKLRGVSSVVPPNRNVPRSSTTVILFIAAPDVLVADKIYVTVPSAS